MRDQMLAFRNALDACDLQDLGFSGSNYTWCNGEFGSQRTLIRLDRMVANAVDELFRGAMVYHKSMAAYDHCALVLHTKTKRLQRKKKPRFRFESMWLRDRGCREVVELAWDATNPYGDLTMRGDRIKNCQNQLRWWNTNVFGHVNKQLQQKQEQLQHLESLNTLHDFAENIALLRKEINDLLDKENDMWWQRSEFMDATG
ncbi:uncharacterized protein LOC142606051 [Castanea sativa]|uniref:uncharacterized protein LOC142606051 n=1 Tax=Castanea sativa TaxID=21020 RepID=UPI003F653823